jgi:hypothetical protein
VYTLFNKEKEKFQMLGAGGTVLINKYRHCLSKSAWKWNMAANYKKVQGQSLVLANSIMIQNVKVLYKENKS